MCGIVGCISNENVSDLLVDSLKRLQYRGYDSAGVALIDSNKKICVAKKKGKIDELSEAISLLDSFTGNIGIGHTRWATHGGANDVNAHPHVSGSVAIVHNGIINNYLTLKAELESKGYFFKSKTDSEVIAHLINYCYENNGHDPEQAVVAAAQRLTGGFAIAVIFENENKIIAYSRKNPLVVGICEGKNVVASDCVAILPITRNVIRLSDDQMAVVTTSDVQVFSCDMQTGVACEIGVEPETVLWDIDAAEKGGYTHFMMKEIMEQPEAVRRTVTAYVNANNEIDFGFPHSADEYIKTVQNIYIVGCGSAYHAGVVGCTVAENTLGLNMRTYLASEFIYSRPVLNDKTLVIAISQSGETADTARAVEYAREKGAQVLSILNVVGSTISALSDFCIYTHAGPEIAVATTKAYTAQLVVLYMLTAYVAKLKHIDCEIAQSCVSALTALPDKLQQLLAQKDLFLNYAAKYKDAGSVFFIGRSLDYALSLEGSLKLKEISYIHSEAYAAGELKHGTISLIEDGTLVIALCTCSQLIEKMASSIQEVSSRKADVIAIVKECDREHIDALKNAVSEIIVLPDAEEFVQPSIAIIPLQFFAYYVALIRNCSIDTPRNLAKSVTVE